MGVPIGKWHGQNRHIAAMALIAQGADWIEKDHCDFREWDHKVKSQHEGAGSNKQLQHLGAELLDWPPDQKVDPRWTTFAFRRAVDALILLRDTETPGGRSAWDRVLDGLSVAGDQMGISDSDRMDWAQARLLYEFDPARFNDPFAYGKRHGRRLLRIERPAPSLDDGGSDEPQ